MVCKMVSFLRPLQFNFYWTYARRPHQALLRLQTAMIYGLPV
uniref:Uncharacterized protein n=1 Tax=Arundo donax TaxID=35708 RepID=A0A0A9C9F6_ARUDO